MIGQKVALAFDKAQHNIMHIDPVPTNTVSYRSSPQQHCVAAKSLATPFPNLVTCCGGEVHEEFWRPPARPPVHPPTYPCIRYARARARARLVHWHGMDVPVNIDGPSIYPWTIHAWTIHGHHGIMESWMSMEMIHGPWSMGTMRSVDAVTLNIIGGDIYTMWISYPWTRAPKPFSSPNATPLKLRRFHFSTKH